MVHDPRDWDERLEPGYDPGPAFCTICDEEAEDCECEEPNWVSWKEYNDRKEEVQDHS